MWLASWRISPVRCTPLSHNTEVFKEHFAGVSLGNASKRHEGIPYSGDGEVKHVSLCRLFWDLYLLAVLSNGNRNVEHNDCKDSFHYRHFVYVCVRAQIDVGVCTNVDGVCAYVWVCNVCLLSPEAPFLGLPIEKHRIK